MNRDGGCTRRERERERVTDIKRERGCETKSDTEGASGEEEMQTGMFLWALRKDLG